MWLQYVNENECSPSKLTEEEKRMFCVSPDGNIFKGFYKLTPERKVMKNTKDPMWCMFTPPKKNISQFSLINHQDIPVRLKRNETFSTFSSSFPKPYEKKSALKENE